MSCTRPRLLRISLAVGIGVAGAAAALAAASPAHAQATIRSRDVLTSDWAHAYSREQAAFPTGVRADGKYWPTVARIDNVYGDRNLICACPPLESYAEAAE